VRNRCLVVDDDDLVRRLIGFSLPRAGFEVVAEATNASDALDAAASAQPDIVLVDLSMPGDDGLATVAGLRLVLPDALIVVLSGMPVEEMEAACLEAGADHYLEKSALPHIGTVLTGLRAETGNEKW